MFSDWCQCLQARFFIGRCLSRHTLWLQGSVIAAAVIDPCLYRHAFWLDLFVDSFVVFRLSHWSHALHQYNAVFSRHAFWLVAFSPARFLIGRFFAGALSHWSLSLRRRGFWSAQMWRPGVSTSGACPSWSTTPSPTTNLTMFTGLTVQEHFSGDKLWNRYGCVWVPVASTGIYLHS